MKILITGGAGFVGSWLARSFKEEYPNAQVVVFDNLKRRGSEKIFLCGRTKLAAEIVVEEYAHLYGLRAISLSSSIV